MSSDTVKLLARYNRQANAETGRICAEEKHTSCRR
jgi:hypothetical protein